jgi:hypothetical protein
MTVGELIEKLKKFPKDMEVLVGSDDYYGPIDSDPEEIDFAKKPSVWLYCAHGDPL